MAFEYDGGVILAADCRSTSGNYVANRSNDKLYPLCKNIVAAKSGSAADTQFILGTIVKYLYQFEMEYQGVIPVKVAATLIAKLTYQYKNYFSAGILIGGVDEEGPAVYSISYGACIRQPIVLSGSGSGFITGFIDVNYNKDFNLEQGIGFAKTCVAMALNRDNSSGGGCRVASVKIDGYTRYEFSFNQLDHQN